MKLTASHAVWKVDRHKRVVLESFLARKQLQWMPRFALVVNVQGNMQNDMLGGWEYFFQVWMSWREANQHSEEARSTKTKPKMF